MIKLRQLLLEQLTKKDKTKSLVDEGTRNSKQLMATGKLPKEIFDLFKKIDDTKNNKYVDWLSKLYVNNDRIVKKMTKKNIELIKKTLEKFNIFTSDNKITKEDSNVEIYDSFDQLKSKVDIFSEKPMEVVLDTPDLLVVVPHTHKASKKLGFGDFSYRECEDGTKDSAWCTTHIDPKDFNSYYYDRKSTLYYIKVKSQDLLNKLRKNKFESQFDMVAVVVPADNKREKIAFTARDNKFDGTRLNKYLKTTGIDPLILIPRNLENREKESWGVIYREIQNKIENGVYDGDIDLYSENITDLKIVIPSNLKKVTGKFTCSIHLNNLKGSPEEVDEFDCSDSTSLKSLEGAPKTVHTLFDCSNSKSLISLEGAPKRVEKFDCSNSTSLKSLKGAPEEVDEFDCSNSNTKFTEEYVRKMIPEVDEVYT